MTADCARLCLWCLIAPLLLPRFCFAHFPVSHSRHLSSSLLPRPCKNPWWILGITPAPFQKEWKYRPLCAISFPLPLFSPSQPPTHLSSFPPRPSSPSNLPFHLPRQAVQSSAAAPTWISLSSPSGNVCWSFRVSCQTRVWGEGKGGWWRGRD